MPRSHRNLRIKGRSKSSKNIIVHSDIHVGSIMGVCTEAPIVKENGVENYYTPNKLQKNLHKIWIEATDDFDRRKASLHVTNGEPIDGSNRKQEGNQSWSTNLNDQANDSIKLIKSIKAEKRLFVRGSGYHVQLGGTSIEGFIADNIGGVDYSVIEGIKNNAQYWANISCYGKVINFTHHIGHTKYPAYRTTPLARESSTMSLDKERNMKYDILVRSHVHYYIETRTTNTIAFTTPAWKYPDAHLTRGGLGGIFPDIGCMEIIIEPNGEVEVKKHITELTIKPQVFKLA